MKFFENQQRTLFFVCLLIGALISGFTNYYNRSHTSDPNTYGRYIAWFFYIVALLLLVPWDKGKEKE